MASGVNLRPLLPRGLFGFATRAWGIHRGGWSRDCEVRFVYRRRVPRDLRDPRRRRRPPVAGVSGPVGPIPSGPPPVAPYGSGESAPPRLDFLKVLDAILRTAPSFIPLCARMVFFTCDIHAERLPPIFVESSSMSSILFTGVEEFYRDGRQILRRTDRTNSTDTPAPEVCRDWHAPCEVRGGGRPSLGDPSQRLGAPTHPGGGLPRATTAGEGRRCSNPE